MACKGARRGQQQVPKEIAELEELINAGQFQEDEEERLLFGVESKFKSDNILQNNITQYEWVERNKIAPNFWGRNITGKNCLTKEEIEFLHRNACKVVAIYAEDEEKLTENQGVKMGRKAVDAALKLGIPKKNAIFLEVKNEENASKNFMRGYAKALLEAGYTPGFKGNTDAKFTFDASFSRGMQVDGSIFRQCIVWSEAPTIEKYDKMTTTHFIHPDNWTPFAPSCIRRKDIGVWQYGTDSHPIYDLNDVETSVNLNLVRNSKIIIEKMF